MNQHKSTADELINKIHEQKRQRVWRFYQFMIGITLVVVVFGLSWFIWQSLYPCKWLNRLLQRSGCYQTILVDNLTVDAIAVAPNNHVIAVGGI